MAMTVTAVPGAELLVEAEGALRTMVLDRPQALNALSVPMITGMRRLLDTFEADPAVGYVAVRGAGDRALCAGGDIRQLYKSALEPDGWPQFMWSEEYALNARIALHVRVLAGRDPHHIAEAQFKAVARALRAAIEPDPRVAGVPSTKGTL